MMKGGLITVFSLLAALAVCGPAQAHYNGELLPDSVAVMEYRMIINMDPDDTLTRNKLGMVYIRQGKLDKARKEFMEILDRAPEDFDALDSLGIVSEQEGRHEEAAGWYEKALKVRPGDEGVKKRLDAVKKKLGK